MFYLCLLYSYNVFLNIAVNYFSLCNILNLIDSIADGDSGHFQFATCICKAVMRIHILYPVASI